MFSAQILHEKLVESFGIFSHFSYLLGNHIQNLCGMMEEEGKNVFHLYVNSSENGAG